MRIVLKANILTDVTKPNVHSLLIFQFLINQFNDIKLDLPLSTIV